MTAHMHPFEPNATAHEKIAKLFLFERVFTPSDPHRLLFERVFAPSEPRRLFKNIFQTEGENWKNEHFLEAGEKIGEMLS